MARDTKKKDDGKQQGGGRSLLLGLLVVVATGGAIFAFGRGGDEEVQEQAPVEEEVLELTPLMPSNAIRSASWHRDGSPSREAAADDEEDGTVSLLERAEFGPDGTRMSELDKSIEETVSEIHGLGVYVDKSNDDEPKKKNK